MQVSDYTFSGQLEMSNGQAATDDICQVLLQVIPGALNVHKSATQNDKKGVDYWIETVNCAHLAVDVKVREIDWAARDKDKDDLALETWSVVENHSIGWTRDESKKCDYVFWYWIETKRYCLIPFRELCAVFKQKWQEWGSEYGLQRQLTKPNNYHSECVFVPRRIVWAEIYKFCGGNS